MPDIRHCPQCGAELPADAPEGVCPKCLIGLGLGSQPAGAGVSGPEAAQGQAATTPFTPRRGFIAPAPAELAKHFPQLEIVELLGSGGMGAVYKARQPGLDRLVALKILPPEVGQDPVFAERFTREARALAKLSHQNIVTVHDFGQAGGLYYFLMELVDGANLRRLIAQGKLDPREALAIVPQICDALQFAHDEGVVHRDVKPENILIDKKGRVKIADFGLARLLGVGQAFQPDSPASPISPERLTYSGQVMGTPQYMAPEQTERPLSVDHRADIYSLGVVFYEMLTGELPLGRFAPPSKKVEVDVRLDEVVLRSLEKEPERRYQQATEVKTDVESISRTPRASPAAAAAAALTRKAPELEPDNGLSSKFAESAVVAIRRRIPMVAWSALVFFSMLLFFTAVVVVNWKGNPFTGSGVLGHPEKTRPETPELNAQRSGWLLGSDGPALTDVFAWTVLKLQPTQIERVNRILRGIYAEYAALEAENSEQHIDDAGHLVIRINPFPGSIAKLEHRLWSQLDEILDPQQQSIARLNLKLDPPELQLTPISVSELVRPGFFGWGKEGASIEIWRVGEWYHWKVQSRGFEDSSSAPQLPVEYRRFWKEPAANNGTASVAATATDDERIQGTWNVASEIYDGRVIDPEEAKAKTVIYANGEGTTLYGDWSEKGTYKLDPTKTPKTMDGVCTEGPDKGLAMAATQVAVAGNSIYVLGDEGFNILRVVRSK